MTEQAAFYVLYRFKVKPGMEDIFKEGWCRMTEAIREQRGGLGSRLHRADDCWWVAYAKWPNRQAWASSQQMSVSPDRDAAALMAEAILERLPPIPLEPEIDLIDRHVGNGRTP